MTLTRSLLLAGLALVSYAAPVSEVFVVHEAIDDLPNGWRHVQPLNSNAPLTLNIALRNSQSASFVAIANAVADPDHGSYGQYLSASAWQDLHSSTTKHREEVASWLSFFDAQIQSDGPDSMTISLPAAKASEMLNTTFAEYSYEDGDQTFVRAQKYSLPLSMLEHIDFIYPTVHFMRPVQDTARSKSILARQHVPTGPVNCTNSVCPQQLKTKYKIDYVPKDSKSGSKIGIAGFIGNVANATDVKSFVQKNGVTGSTNATYGLQRVNRGPLKAATGALQVEATLDLDYTLSFTGPLNATYFTTGGVGMELQQPGNKAKPANESQNEPYLLLLDYILALDQPPQVLSISYTDDEQSVPIKYAQKVCDKFTQAAARGITVLASSGDGGASGTGGSDCRGPDGKPRFVPGFPATCPWVTAVGATAAYGGPASYSGGGFSNFFARPAWQEKQVQKYIKALNGSHTGLYNASGRAIPDVSLLGDNYLINLGEYSQQASGSSASAPVFAAMVALLNDLRLRQGKPVLGFLNPRLYAQNATQVFKDVISDVATTKGCSFGDTFEEGWEALAGWDAATGLGEPDFQKLRKVLV